MTIKSKEIGHLTDNGIRYSICTLVSKSDEYQEMLESFEKAGFKDSFTEYLYIDNSKSNQYDGFSGLNKFLIEAKGKYVILCHQDILLNYDNIEILEKRISEIESMDPNWAIISNAGAGDIEDISIKVTELDLKPITLGKFPLKVKTVDESFILVKRSANLSLSKNLSGFHLYGADICLITSVLGYNSYAVEFNILHKSKGNVDQRFHSIKENLIAKYKKAFEGRFIQTTNTNFYISGSGIKNFFFNLKIVKLFVRKYFKLKKKRLNQASK